MEWLWLNDNLGCPRPRERVRAAAWGLDAPTLIGTGDDVTSLVLEIVEKAKSSNGSSESSGTATGVPSVGR